jgi:thioredoxin-dependent peroxiredoxin
MQKKISIHKAERLKKYCSHFGARIFGFWRGFGEGAGWKPPVPEPKRSQKSKRPLLQFPFPNGYNIFLTALTQLITVAAFCAGVMAASAAEPPKVGDMAPEFKLNTLQGSEVSLKGLPKDHPIVLILLRGWPGYQCPVCTAQVHDFVSHAMELQGKAQVVMVYPGPAEMLKEHANEFIMDKQWPKEFIFLMDPDYTFTKAYGLRWDAANETAYPSTFIIDRDGKVSFAKISHTHTGRASATEVLKALKM